MAAKTDEATGVGLNFDFFLGHIDKALDKHASEVRTPQPLRRDFAVAAVTPASAVPNPFLLKVQMQPAAGRLYELTDIGVYTTDGHTPPAASVTGVTQLALGASPATAFNTNAFPIQVTITGGTVSAIAVNGVTTGSTSGTFTVPAFGNITVTYTVLPTITTAATAQIVADTYAGPSAGLDSPGDMGSFVFSSAVPTTSPLLGDKKAFAESMDYIYAWVYNVGPNQILSLAGTVFDWRVRDREETRI